MHLHLTLADIYDPNGAHPQLVWAIWVDRTLYIGQIRWQGMHTLQTHVCYGSAPEAAVGYLATKGQLVGVYDSGWLRWVN